MNLDLNDSWEFDSPDFDIEVDDPDEYVDRRVKDRILQLKARVSDREDQLWAGLLDPSTNYTEEHALQVWTNTVKLYLRELEPIILNVPSENNTEYYNNVHLGTVKLVPPDNNGIPFSHVARPDFSPADLERQLGVYDIDWPEIHRQKFNGLKSIIEAEPVVHHEWYIKTGGWGPSSETVTLQAAKPIPKRLLENAMRVSSKYLQEIGIGVDASAEDYMGQDADEAGI